MQGSLNKNFSWLEIVETLSVVGSIGGSIASVVSQQIVLASASIPLSLCVALHLVNRKRLLNSINQSHQNAVSQLAQGNVETQAKLEMLTEQLTQVQQLATDLNQSQVNSNLAVAQLVQENVETQATFEKMTDQLVEVQQLTIALDKGTSNLNIFTQRLNKEQTNIAHKVSCLREIETCTQAIRINPNDAQAYYSRGVVYQHLGYKEAAVWDFNESIRIKPCYAEAYQERGLTRAYLGDKKGAVKDFREATKLFFEEGEIVKYQIVKDLSKQFYDLNSQPRIEPPEEVAVKCLFS